jgi:glycine/D-amino acid oxidase-like deaminating enzyme
MMIPVNAEAKMRRMVGEKMAAAFPTMGAPTLSYIWNGYIAITPDRWPRVHRYGPDFWGWIGCNGRGVALGVAMGREIAAALDGVDPNTLALPLSDPQPIPFHAIGRRVAPAVLAWYRRRDKVEPKL